MRYLKIFEDSNEGTKELGTFILSALDLKWYKDFSSNKDNTEYDEKKIFTFNVVHDIKVEEVDQRGVFVSIDGKKQTFDSAVAVKIANKCKEISNEIR